MKAVTVSHDKQKWELLKAMAVESRSRFAGSKNPNWSGGIQGSCSQCQRLIWIKPSRIGRHKHHFCNQVCRDAWFSVNTRGENGSNWRGGNLNLQCISCQHPFEASRAEFERRETRFCSRECYFKGAAGENSPFWKGGLLAQRRRYYQKIKDTPEHRIRRRIARNIRRSLVVRKGGRSTWRLLGYSLSDLISHLSETMPTGCT